MKLLFPTLIHEVTVPTFKQIESDLIKFAYQEKKKDSVGVIISNQGGWQSNSLDFDNILSKVIIESVEKYFITTRILNEGVVVRFNNIWVNINKRGAYNVKHDHPNCDLSGVLWIKIPKDSGDIIFENPMGFHEFNQIHSYNKDWKDKINLHHSYWFPPEEGKVLIFPSYLMHQVTVSKSNKDRISASFNITLMEE